MLRPSLSCWWLDWMLWLVVVCSQISIAFWFGFVLLSCLLRDEKHGISLRSDEMTRCWWDVRNRSASTKTIFYPCFFLSLLSEIRLVWKLVTEWTIFWLVPDFFMSCFAVLVVPYPPGTSCERVHVPYSSNKIKVSTVLRGVISIFLIATAPPQGRHRPQFFILYRISSVEKLKQTLLSRETACCLLDYDN